MNTTGKTKELLFSVTIADCEVQPFRASGPGGQHRNKVCTAIRLIHHPSGAVIEAKDQRSQWANKQNAFMRLTEHPKFKIWHKMETARRLGQPTVEELVDRAMQPHNLKVEYKHGDEPWIEEQQGDEAK